MRRGKGADSATFIHNLVKFSRLLFLKKIEPLNANMNYSLTLSSRYDQTILFSVNVNSGFGMFDQPRLMALEKCVHVMIED